MDGNLLIENIRTLCKKNKVSITKLESDLFLSPGLISRWNKSMPAMDKIMDIANYFDVSIDELVGRSKKDSDHVDIGRLLIILYNRSVIAETIWDILDFENLPAALTHITPVHFLQKKSCDCYYTNYMDGFFFLTSTHSPSGDLQLALFTLPDVYSTPECVCLDTDSLMQLYQHLNRLLSRQLNKIKSSNFINAYIADSSSEDFPSDEKITPLRGIHEASNF